MKSLNWKHGALLCGALGAVAVALGVPLDVLNQYAVAVAVIFNNFIPTALIGPEYFTATQPGAIGLGFIFIAGLMAGSWLAHSLGKEKLSEEEKALPKTWKNARGKETGPRFLWATLGGCLMVLGAAMSGSSLFGHVFNGVIQLSVGGLLFVVATALGGMAMAKWFYEGEKK